MGLRALRGALEVRHLNGARHLHVPDEGERMICFSIPGAPVGKGRPKFARRGNFVHAYTPEKTVSYENLVKIKAGEAMQGKTPLEGAAAVKLFLFVAPPASWSQKKQRAAMAGEIHPTAKPDMDNVVKGIFDACNAIVWLDDKQVCRLEVVKRFAAVPGAVVEVEAL
jgi:Holliday junction resolvase RusA-like endonuclease